MGSGGWWAWQQIRGPGPEVVAARRELTELSKACAEAEERATQARQRLLGLEAAHAELIRRVEPSSALAAPAAATGPEPWDAGPSWPAPDERSARLFHASRLREQADRWKRRLQLTMAQAQVVEQALAQDLKAIETLSPRELGNATTFLREMERVLTPEQRAKYDEVQQKEKRESRELHARFELSQVERAVELSEAQRQAILQKVLTDNPMDLAMRDASADDQDPLALSRRLMDRRVEALEGILTPTQLEEYRDQLSAQMEQMEVFTKSRASTARSTR